MDAFGLRGFARLDDEPAPLPPSMGRGVPMGMVVEVSGGGAKLMLDARALERLAADPDPSTALSGQVGSQVKIAVGGFWLLANVRALKLQDPGDHVIAEVDFLGEGREDPDTLELRGFRRGVTRYPAPAAAVHAVGRREMAEMFTAEDRPHIELGTVYPTRDVRAALYIDPFLGKHFALLGSTGTGKSTAAALILHRIREHAPNGHIVMIDPHGEYPAAFEGYGELLDVDNLNLPYWLMNFDEHAEVFVTSQGSERQRDMDVLAKCLYQARAKSRQAACVPKLTVDSPIPYLLSDLVSAIVTEMGKLDRAGDTSSHMRLKTKIEEIRVDPRYAFMFSGMLVADTMAQFLGRIFRLPGNGKPISIIDVSGVPSDITSVVVALLSRLVFDYAIWSRNEAQRPILLVCEEAHRYVPSDRVATGAAVRRILERIAKEGRKYGVSLGLITQRPSDLAEGVLSQCGTIIAMRLNNERDQAHVRAAMPEGARGFLDVIPALRNQECIICGEGVAVPIRVTLDNLEEARRPSSADPSFARLWQDSGGEADLLERAIVRWRRQGH